MTSFLTALSNNPVLINELRIRMRGRRAFILLGGHLVLLSGLVFLIYLSIYQDTQSSSRFYFDGGFQQAIQASATAGKAIFYGTNLLLLLFVSLVAPAFTSGALVGEKERQTYELLTITTLSARSIVVGKLNAIMTFIVLLIAATLPIQTMAYFFGGVDIREVIISVLLLLVTALLFCTLGLFISSFARSSTAANMITYATVIPLLMGVPFVILFTGILSAGILFDNFLFSNPPYALALVLIYVIAFFISVNPLSMAVASEIFILETGSYFYSVESFFDFDVPIIAPWIVYIIFGLLMSLVFINGAIQRVNRTSIL